MQINNWSDSAFLLPKNYAEEGVTLLDLQNSLNSTQS